MKKGMFYSVGVGPGDPDLMTFKAVKVINESDVIVAPVSGGKENIALKISKEHLEGKKIVLCDMPMIRDKKLLEEAHVKATEQMEEFLQQGLTVAFLTLGDPTIYSTPLYVHNRLKQKGYETKIVPGIPSFCAAAASLNVSLCEGNETLHIIPASHGKNSLVDLTGNKVFMKTGKHLKVLKENITSDQKDRQVMMVECASMENEKVSHSIEDIDESSSYFSVIVVKESGGI